MTKKLFIADDELDFLSTLKARLEFEGFVVATAVDGKEALRKIREEKPDLVLLDVMMPKMNGYQVCRELKRDSTTESIPVVMVTAKSQESDRFWGKEVGADAYVTKPVDIDELIEKISGFLGE